VLNTVLSSRVSRVSAMVSVRYKYRVDHGIRIWDAVLRIAKLCFIFVNICELKQVSIDNAALKCMLPLL